MVGPDAARESQDLIALDPGASRTGGQRRQRRHHAADACRQVSPCALSPRVVAIPVFNPDMWDLTVHPTVEAQ